MAYKRLGEVLIAAGLITDEQLQEAIRIQKTEKLRLGKLLVTHGFITERQLLEALEMQLGVEFVDLFKLPIAPEMAKLLSKNIAKKYNVIPIKVVKDDLYLAMSDPLNFFAIEAVRSATRKQVIPVLATEDATEYAISNLYGNVGVAKAIEDLNKEVTDMPEQTELAGGEDINSAPVVRLVNSIIERAITERASDIHLEPWEESFLVRMRIDGQMRNAMEVPKPLQPTVIARLKIMGGMDISERKRPQDGRANMSLKGKEIDMRLSTLPTVYGEKIVIRLLDKGARLLTPEGVGLSGEDLVKYRRMLENPSGVVLITGPTGSGKSSTLYTMINRLNTESVNIVSLEDPVEYNIDGVNQVQINEKVGMTFASGLRSILRQDPDIISVGEIRDGETASIAMRAAITGHLVLSTIHTNDAISVIERLRDIGVEPYLIASALRGVVAQRLVRKLCVHCRKPYTPSVEELQILRIPPEEAEGVQFYKSEGCPMCGSVGYVGRTGVFEMLLISAQLRAAIAADEPRETLEEIIDRTTPFVTIAGNCRRLVLEGVTSCDEARKLMVSTDA